MPMWHSVLLPFLPAHCGVLQNAGGDTPYAITRLTAAFVSKQLPKRPDQSFSKVTSAGHYSLQGGRIAIATTNPVPMRDTELSSHPIRDVWVL